MLDIYLKAAEFVFHYSTVKQINLDKESPQVITRNLNHHYSKVTNELQFKKELLVFRWTY